MITLTSEQIRTILPSINLINEIEKGFVAYSDGKAVVPPVGELILPKGEVHIKYGFINGEEYYVVKIASGFYKNPALGLPSGNGLILLFSQETGEAVCALYDEGLLTDVRTAVAGAIVAKHLAPSEIEKIGIVGTGTQGRLQLMYLKNIVSCKRVLVWGRNKQKLATYKSDMEAQGFEIQTTSHVQEVQERCNLIISCTPSKEPLLKAGHLKKGTHITAVGSDTPDKQELDSALFKKAQLVVADSIDQCLVRGEISHAIRTNDLEKHHIVELGALISGKITGRKNDEQITIADLTGVAVQDIKIAAAVYHAAGK